MNIFNEFEKAKQTIQKSNVFDIKEVAENEINKLIKVAEDYLVTEQEEFKQGKDNDFAIIVFVAGLVSGALLGVIFFFSILLNMERRTGLERRRDSDSCPLSPECADKLIKGHEVLLNRVEIMEKQLSEIHDRFVHAKISYQACDLALLLCLFLLCLSW